MEASRQDIHKYLIERCLKKDRKAQYQIYKLYADAMYNVCLRMMKNTDDAQDMLQDAFVDAFAKLSSFRFDASFGSWLKRIVINKCINALNKKKLLIAEMNQEQLHQIEDEHHEDLDLNFEVKMLHEAIKKLPNGCRVVLNLYLFEGYDHQEIADILEVSVSTSKAQYSKAKKKLRVLFEQLTTKNF